MVIGQVHFLANHSHIQFIVNPTGKNPKAVISYSMVRVKSI